MNTQAALKTRILSLDGRGYPAYRDLKGKWDFGDYVLSIDHVQSDPFASPSDLTVEIAKPGFPAHLYENRACRVALQDALLRLFGKKLRSAEVKKSGSGKSGAITCAATAQEVLERSSCTIDPATGALKLRLNAGFPAKGRSILARKLVELLFNTLPPLIRSTLIYANLTDKEKDDLQKVYELTVDQEEIRRQLEERHLVAFVANGSILPRESGASNLPMKGAVPFVSAPEEEIELDLPYAGKVSGMGIGEGVTLIVGGGYHGKSTLLNALERGVYNHIGGDGREFVITRDDAMKVRAEDGRCVHHENISAFIQNLPGGKSTENFVSEDASGSTSQAANVIEAMEAGSRALLIDEDTSATNFMIRDELMNEVVSASEEPIIPYIARIRELADQGISTILVAGSSGLFFDKADRVIQMKEYKPYEITALAKEKAKAFPPAASAKEPMKKVPPRLVLSNPKLLQDKVKVKTSALDALLIARESIDLRALEQLVDSQQSAAIGKMIVYAQRNLVDGKKNAEQIADELEELADKNGLSFFGKGYLSRPRRYELLGVLNRQRSQQFALPEQTKKN